MLAAGAVQGGATTGQNDRPASRRENVALHLETHAMERQPRVSDLIPSHPLAFLLWFLGGLAVIVGLEALYAWMPELAAMTQDGRVAAFDLDGEGSLAAWFSSTTLMLASLLALIVWSIRRHKPDDYHARYRVWAWAATCWLILAIDESASLHEGFKELAVWLTGLRPGMDGSLWWVAAYLPLLGWVGVRLLMEMKSCRSSTCALAAAAICYLAAVAVQLGWLLPETGARGVMLEEGCEMLGNLFLALAMAVHARYVILEAQGLLPSHATAQTLADNAQPQHDLQAAALASASSKNTTAAAKPAPNDKSTAKPAPPSPTTPQHQEGNVRRVDAAHPTPPPATRQHEHVAVRATSPHAPTQQSATPENPTRRKLTKAERKALRRQQRQEDELD